jgi:phenylacetate-CoA ligase
MVAVRGVNLYPTAVEAVVRRFPAIVEYQVEIRTAGALPEVTLLLEPAPDHPDPSGLAAEVQSALRATFLLRIPVSLAPPGALPRFELKARRWRRVNE